MPLALSILLAATSCFPGLIISQAFEARPQATWVTAALRGVMVSVAMLVVATLVLLRFQAFSLLTTLAVLWVPAIALLAVRRGRIVAALSELRAPRQDMLAVGTLLGIAGALVAFTAHWNFLAASGMDGGNYEAYASFWSVTGRLYVPAGELFEAGAERSWLGGVNTWVLRGGWDTARPNYFYGYPALLALVRSASHSLASSWVVSGVAASISVVALYVLGVRLAGRRLLAWATALLILLTPVYLFYAKQIMSETVALMGVLAVILGILGMDRDRVPDPWMLGAGLVLTFSSKIDATLPVFALLGAAGLVAVLGWWPGRRPTPAWGAAGLTGTLLSLGLVVGMVDPGYLGKSDVGKRFPGLASLPGADVPLFAWLLLATAAGWLLIPYLLRRRTERASSQEVRAGVVGSEPLTTPVRAVVSAAAVAWLAYLGWNLFVRPATGTLEENFDALNLVRLDDVFSLALLVVIALFPAAAALSGRGSRDTLMVAAPLLVVLGYLIFDANHSPAQLWWMRRYLVVLAPMAMIGVAGLVGALGPLASARPRITGVVTVIVFLAVGVVHVRSVLPVFDYRQNVRAPTLLHALSEEVEDPFVVAVVADASVVRSLGVTLSSVEGAPVLPDMTTESLDDALSRLAEQRVYVVSDQPLSLVDRSLELVTQGTFENQWTGWMFRLDQDPSLYLREAEYWLYVRPGQVPTEAGMTQGQAAR